MRSTSASCASIASREDFAVVEEAVVDRPRYTVPRRDLRADTLQRGARVEEQQPARLQRRQDRRHRLRGCGEARAHMVGHANIAADPAQHPFQAVEVLFRRQRREQRPWPRVARRVVQRLHRQVDQHLMANGAGQPDPVLQVLRIGLEGQRDLARQVADGRLCRRAGQAERTNDDGDAWAPVAGIERAGVDAPRLAAVGADARQRSQRRVLHQRGIGCRGQWPRRLRARPPPAASLQPPYHGPCSRRAAP